MKLHSVAAMAGALATSAVAQTPDFDWASLAATKDLQWQDCYGKLQCARLELPLNYNDTSDDRTVGIAIARLPATVDESDPSFAGSLWTNPGGPGHSGVLLVRADGEMLRNKADIPGKRHYEIISFDPRGVGNSTPTSDCWGGSVLAATAQSLELHGTTGLDRGYEPLTFSLAMSKAMGTKCYNSNDDHVMGYFGTPNVARDMVEMLDLVEGQRGSSNGTSSSSKRSHSCRDSSGVARMQYVGFSYGTALGAYFAALYPGRVGRMVLDGVVDAKDYADGPGWLTSTEDADKVMDLYLETCYEAGPEACGMASADDTSADDTRNRFFTRLDAIDKEPVPYVSPLDGTLQVITGDDIRLAVSTILYNPVQLWPTYSTVFNEALDGNVDRLAGALQLTGARPLLDDSVCGTKQADFTLQVEAQNAVVCADGTNVTDKDVAYWQDYVDQQTNQSVIAGPYISTLRFACAGWKFQPNTQFRGPFTFPDPDPSGVDGKPLTGILFSSNVLDPVAPLSSAQKMADRFPGSYLLTQNASGHCALTSAPSNCTTDVFRTYLDTGKLEGEDDEHEVTCEPNCGPWDPGCAAQLGAGASVGPGAATGTKRGKNNNKNKDQAAMARDLASMSGFATGVSDITSLPPLRRSPFVQPSA